MSYPDLVKQLTKQLPLCLNQDRHFLKRQIDRLRSEFQKGKNPLEQLNTLSSRIEKSVVSRNKRFASIPLLNFPDLPVSAKKDEIASLIQKNQVVIICGETGSGKTTQLPKICLSIGLGVGGFIGHTQPRRIAARTVAVAVGGQGLRHRLGRSDNRREAPSP